jgi:hypothetical protein
MTGNCSIGMLLTQHSIGKHSGMSHCLPALFFFFGGGAVMYVTVLTISEV